MIFLQITTETIHYHFITIYDYCHVLQYVEQKKKKRTVLFETMGVITDLKRNSIALIGFFVKSFLN
jgi:hypothetical protein